MNILTGKKLHYKCMLICAKEKRLTYLERVKLSWFKFILCFTPYKKYEGTLKENFITLLNNIFCSRKMKKHSKIVNDIIDEILREKGE